MHCLKTRIFIDEAHRVFYSLNVLSNIIFLSFYEECIKKNFFFQNSPSASILYTWVARRFAYGFMTSVLAAVYKTVVGRQGLPMTAFVSRRTAGTGTPEHRYASELLVVLYRTVTVTFV